MRLVFGFLVCMGLSALVSAQAGSLLLHPMFQDHAVLQRDKPVRVWGMATPGATVEVTFASHTSRAKADKAGAWAATFKPLPAGGPYELSAVSGADTQAVKDILVGDVYLCSGQSNMEMPMRLASRYDSYTNGARNQNIRLLHVARAASYKPLTAFSVAPLWEVVGPQSVQNFSAACYYFGRALQPVANVPLGLIEAAWGGTRIEAWLDSPTLTTLGGNDEQLKILTDYKTDPLAATKHWQSLAEAWWREHDSGSKANPPWSAPGYDDSRWSVAPSFGNWEGWNVPSLEAFDGIVWYRKTVTLTDSQAKSDAVLNLGRVDDADTSWVNGVQVGLQYGNNIKRSYTIPAGTLHAGDNVVAVGVLDSATMGGFLDNPAEQNISFGDGSRVPLGPSWRYQIADTIYKTGDMPRPAPSLGTGPTGLYNGMIAPLGPISLKGILWYQGEANTGSAVAYGNQLKALIASWRQRFGSDVAFLNTQLAAFGRARFEPGNSGWPELREQQRLVANEVANSGMAVTIDIGQRDDVHPNDKKNVGERLALVAEKLIYQKDVIAAGPQPTTAIRKGDKILVGLSHVEGGLKVYEWRAPIGFQLCKSGGRCVFADAAVEDGSIALDAKLLPEADTIRYCWSDSPICNLYNGAGLPAVPFRLPIN